MKENLIDRVITTEKSRAEVRKLIPVMVKWAMSGITSKTYAALIHELGYKAYSGIGRTLGNIAIVLEELRKETGDKDIPTLNALITNPKTNLPSDGFDFVYEHYSQMNQNEKETLVKGINADAIKYDNWDWVLDQLGLKLPVTFSEEELESVGKTHSGTGGEGKEHKALKEYVYNHPESIGIKSIGYSAMEYVLPSADRIDVYFRNRSQDRIAVEVKPSTSPEDDLTRGIFQCIKYKAIMNAVRITTNAKYKVDAILVTAATLSEQNRKLAEDLNVKFIEGFQIS